MSPAKYSVCRYVDNFKLVIVPSSAINYKMVLHGHQGIYIDQQGSRHEIINLFEGDKSRANIIYKALLKIDDVSRKAKLSKLGVHKQESISIMPNEEHKSLATIFYEVLLKSDDSVRNAKLSKLGVNKQESTSIQPKEEFWDHSCIPETLEEVKEIFGNVSPVHDYSTATIPELSDAIKMEEDISEEKHILESTTPENIDFLQLPTTHVDQDAPSENASIHVVSRGKKIYCLFCKKCVAHFARHLENRHRNESAVKSFLKLPKNSYVRKKCIRGLQVKGSREFNKTEGTFFIGRAIRKCRNPKTLTPCPSCKLMFNKKCLSGHWKMCTGASKAPRTLIRESQKLLEIKRPELDKA